DGTSRPRLSPGPLFVSRGTCGDSKGVAKSPGKRAVCGKKRVEKLWRFGCLNEKGFTPHRRKPLYGKVPKRGLEPPLPKREPGREPGASASSATSASKTV